MANEVWTFKPLENGKVELLGRMAPKDTDPAKLPGASHAVVHDGHTLVVRSSDGFAEKCRTCEVTGLVPGQICEFISKYNDEQHPL